MGTQHHELSGADLHQPFRIGTHANRPASPAQGDWYYETDTKKLFKCDTANTWVEVNVVESKAPTTQVFTSSSGTYTTPTGVKWIKVRMVGGGGGGCGVSNGVGYITGSNGVTSQFGTVYANPGSGASAGGGGGGSGGSGTATLRIPGESVSHVSADPGNTTGGHGGASILGFGGAGGQGAGGSGSSAATNSGGGGGGSGGKTEWGAYSASGGGGGEYVEIYITSPSSTYSYAVGAGGAGGDGASADGGAGGSGIIIVEEHYN